MHLTLLVFTDNCRIFDLDQLLLLRLLQLLKGVVSGLLVWKSSYYLLYWYVTHFLPPKSIRIRIKIENPFEAPHEERSYLATLNGSAD